MSRRRLLNTRVVDLAGGGVVDLTGNEHHLEFSAGLVGRDFDVRDVGETATINENFVLIVVGGIWGKQANNFVGFSGDVVFDGDVA